MRFAAATLLSAGAAASSFESLTPWSGPPSLTEVSMSSTTAAHTNMEMLDGLISGSTHTHEKTFRSWMRQKSQDIDLESAVDSLSKGALPADLMALLRAEAADTDTALVAQKPALIKRAVTEVLYMISNITEKVDRMVIYDCMPFETSRTEQINSAENELAHLESLWNRRSGDRIAALNQIQNAQTSATEVENKIRNLGMQWDMEKWVLLEQKKKAVDDATVCEILVNATLPSSKLLLDQSAKFEVCTADKPDPDEEDPEDSKDGFDDDDVGTDSDQFVLLDKSLKTSFNKLSLVAQRDSATRVKVSNFRPKGRKGGGRNGPGKKSRGQNRCTRDKKGDMMFVLHDRAGTMYGRAADRRDILQNEIAKGDNKFSMEMSALRAEIDGYQSQVRDLQEVVKKAEADLSTFQQQYYQVLWTRWHLIRERYWKRWQCRRALHELVVVEQCALLKMRDNIVKKYMKLDPLKDVQDCEVSQWTNGPCSRSCQGGNRIITRAITTINNKEGAACPRLRAKMVCNTFKCPVDCRVSRFSAWSSCTKKCDDGTSSRNREVVRFSRYKGMSCPALNDEKICNLKPCDVDCKLSNRWSSWSRCSRMCGWGWGWYSQYGKRYRLRKVQTRRQGRGRKCVHRYSWWRLQSRTCNRYRCRGFLRCYERQDLVLAIDTSGNMRTTGFKRIQRLSQSIANRYRLGRRRNKLAIIQFDTKAIVRQQLTYSKKKVDKALAGLKFTGGVTNTHLAIDRAVRVMQAGGRKKAQSVLMIITTANPSRLVAAANSVKHAKKKGIRIVVVIAGAKRYKPLKSMVSFPVRDNFVRIYSLKWMRYYWVRRWFTQRVVRITCPNLRPYPRALFIKFQCRGCKHGKCKRGKCRCNKGWRGRKCNRKAKTCKPKCKNGHCKRGRCKCDSGFKGKSCSKKTRSKKGGSKKKGGKR